jgi:hypothetical protein
LYLFHSIKVFEKGFGEKLFSKSFSPIVIISLLLLGGVVCGCATATTAQKKEILAKRYRVGVVNGGTYTALMQEAVYELSSLREIEVIKEEEINTALAKAGLNSTSLLSASSFEELNSVKSLDFVIVLLPAPPAYPVGSVGIRSINWRSGKIKTIPAVKVPENPVDWLLETRNGWLYFVSDPPGAIVLSNGNPIGITPMVMLVENLPMTFVFKWAEKVETSVTVQSEEQSKIYVRAPGDYYAKHHKKGLYRRLQEADQQYGESVFVVMYVLVIVGGIALLFYNPFK